MGGSSCHALAIVQRNQLLKTLRLIDGLQVLEGGVLQVVKGTIIPPDLEPLLSHEYLSPLGSLVEKMKAGKMVVHEKLIEITKLLIEWDAKIVGVFEETPPQTGDDLLLPEWQEQIAQIMQTMQDNTFSNIPGDLHFQVVYPTGLIQTRSETTMMTMRMIVTKAKISPLKLLTHPQHLSHTPTTTQSQSQTKMRMRMMTT
ncbi:hypothetical protein KEM48_007549 [Puccinia striiformis f. sp. tritici PST-130]|nr:hypothetical protein KEM48_007549 [Puccinia striiformis f. sp. tritici PST-130]